MSEKCWLARWLVGDARHGQIATLGTLLAYGMLRLGFDIGPAQVLVTLGSALGAQAAFEWPWPRGPERPGRRAGWYRGARAR